MISPQTEKKAAFAKRCGISAPRVSQLVKDGLPLADNGEVLVEQALEWMAGRLDPTRRLAAKPGTRQVAATPSEAESDDDAAVIAADLTEAKRLHEIVKTERAKLALLSERGELIPRAEAGRLIMGFAQEHRDSWIAWVSRSAPLLAAELGVDVTLLFPALDRAIREHLGELAGKPTPESFGV